MTTVFIFCSSRLTCVITVFFKAVVSFKYNIYFNSYIVPLYMLYMLKHTQLRSCVC